MSLFQDAVAALHAIEDPEVRQLPDGAFTLGSLYRNQQEMLRQLSLAQAAFLEMIMKHRAGQFINVGLKVTDAEINSLWNALQARQDAILGKRID